jgi:DNA-directed RNA polymerase subunit RPC12/RpoP
MNDSIRDYLKRRVRLTMAIGLGGWLLVAVAMGSTHGKEPPPPLLIAGFVMFGGAILILQWIRCPRCSARLGQCITMGLGFNLSILGRKKSPNFCPYCGVSLDQPYREPGGAVTPR